MRVLTAQSIVKELRHELILDIQCTIEKWQEDLGAMGMYDIMPVGHGRRLYAELCHFGFYSESLEEYLKDLDSDTLRFGNVDYMEGGGGCAYDGLCTEDLIAFAAFIGAAEFGLEPL